MSDIPANVLEEGGKHFIVSVWPTGAAPIEFRICLYKETVEKIKRFEQWKGLRRGNDARTMSPRDRAFQQVVVGILRQAYPERAHQLPNDLFIAYAKAV